MPIHDRGRSQRPAEGGHEEVLDRTYFFLCRCLGRLLRSARYSKAQVDNQHGEAEVRKFRRFYAPLLVWMSGPVLRLLDSGVRVLPQTGWEDRERLIYRELYDAPIRSELDGTLILPWLAGEPLAALLEDARLEEQVRVQIIAWAVTALSEFHRSGFTHGDAMAENVLVDLEGGVARWFDFETVHEPGRTAAWCRADDVRALLVTCVVRTAPEKLVETFQLVLDTYGDEDVTRLLTETFASVFRRPLAFHLAQAGLSFRTYREIARLLTTAGRRSATR